MADDKTKTAAEAAETQLEQTFADLANARLRDKSPALLDYLVGFQMIKANDDGSKAVGIFGFEIGDAWHYAPAFFMNGEIKGLESLYSVSSDMFVPLAEDWVNQIINRRPNQLGEVDNRSRSERGIINPNFSRLKNIPGGHRGFSIGKSACAKHPLMATEQVTKVAEQMELIRRFDDLCSLPSLIGQMGEVVANGFIADLRRHPKIAAAVAEFYPLVGFAEEATKTAADASKAQDDAIKIISKVNDEGAADLTDKQKRELLTGQEVVLDKRPENKKSVVYRTEVNERLQNPTKGGLYDVVMSDGSVEELLVLRAVGDAGYLIVDADKRHGIVAGKRIWTVRQHSDDAFRAKLKSASKSPASISKHDCCVMVTEDGETTLAFEIEDVSGDELKNLRVRGSYWIPRDSGCGMSHFGPVSWSYAHPNEHVSVIVVSDAGSSGLRYMSNRLLVNSKRMHAIVLNTTKSDEYAFPSYERKPSESTLHSSMLGDHTTVRQLLEKVAAPVKVWRTDDDLTIKDQYGTHVLSKIAAVGHLMRRHGCTHEDATSMLKEARREATTYRIKYAAQLLPFPELDDSSEGGFMSQFHMNEGHQQGVEQGQSPDNREAYQYRSPFEGGDQQSTGKAVQRASQTGQKEVFDAQVLASLVKSHNPTDMVDRFLPTIVAGMDRLGRLLFLLHWHYEDFQERYGKEELVEFIDDLKSSFEALGDLVLFMRQRSLAGDPDYYGLGVTATLNG